MNKRSSLFTKLLNAPYILWSAVFIVVPLLMVAYYAFTSTYSLYTVTFFLDGTEHICTVDPETGSVTGYDGEEVSDIDRGGCANAENAQFIVSEYLNVSYTDIAFESSVLETGMGGFTLDNIKKMNTPEMRRATALSFAYSLAATAISLVLAYPFAYVLSRSSVRSQRMQTVLIMLPMWMNMLIRTYSWMQILENNGIVNKFISAIGLEPLEMLGTGGAVILGMVYNYLPYMILPIYTAMSKISPSLLEAADDLGCNAYQKLRRLIFPLSIPGVVSGIIMVFVPSISTFYISQKMSNGNIKLIGDLIELQIKEQYASGGLNVGAAMSLFLMVIILLCTFIMNRFSGKEGGGIVV